MPAIVRFILGSFLVLLAGSAPPVTAQAVRGDLRDVDQNRPLPGARLYLLNEDAVAVDSTLTDRTGRFRLAAPDDGEYTVYFRIDGWASFGSKTLRLESDTIVDLEFRVPLVHNSALSQMRDIIDMDERLQSSLPELCGEPLRPWEAGLLVGVIRVRATGEPIAGARVAVAAPGTGVARSTLSSENGIYILCNVPLGPAVEIVAETPDGTTERTDVEIRAGTVSWYDLSIGPRR